MEGDGDYGISGIQGFVLFLGGMAGSTAMRGKRGGPGGPPRKKKTILQSFINPEIPRLLQKIF
jgi:hypothetical protein